LEKNLISAVFGVGIGVIGSTLQIGHTIDIPLGKKL